MTFRNRMIIADENMPAVEALFNPFGDVKRVAGRGLSHHQVSDADLLLVRSITQVDRPLIQSAKRLSFVGTATIGMDHLDIDYLNHQSIPFANAAGCNADAVVDYVLASIYRYCQKHSLDPTQLVLGIIGVGNVGGRLADRLKQLGVSVLASDPPRAQRDASFEDTPLSQLIEKSDVVCCHLPLSRTGRFPTASLLSKDLLSKMKKGALLVNAGRGPTIDQAGLLSVALERPDVTLVLDVWQDEPRVDSTLVDRTMIATPHIAGYSLEGKLRGTYMLYLSYCQQIGHTPDIPFEAILPDVNLPSLTIGPETTPLDLIEAVYDICGDDLRFRESIKGDPSEQPLRFDQLRKQYPIRREFSSLALKGHATDKQRKVFSALGFNLSEVN